MVIVIPAWRGEATIHRSLASLAQQREGSSFHPSGVRVIVAVNDGSAATVAAAEAHRSALEARGYRYDVISSAPGRRAAFHVAETGVGPSPRLYLDQDARLSPGALDALAGALCGTERPVFAALRPRFSASPSALVRSFLRAWTSLPYFTASPVTMGAYAVSRVGRARWNQLPPIGADDKFVRLLFDPVERLVLADHSYEVLAPTTFGELLAARRRYARMNRELTSHLRRSGPVADADRHAGLALVLRRPRAWPDYAVFGATMLLARVSVLAGRSRTKT